MSLDYISEAFRSLESLNEDIFSTDATSINELSDFMSSDVDDEEKISIIDMDAETEDDLQDSYVGKIICDCNVCHSHVFKDKDQITIDTDGVVDIEDDCPYCGEHNGFVIIGEIAEFNPNSNEEVAEEAVEAEEDTEDPVEEADDEAVEIEEVEEEVLEESLNESPRKFKPHTMKLLRMIGSDLIRDIDEAFDSENGSTAWNSSAIKYFTDAAKNLGLENFNLIERDHKAIFSAKKNGKDLTGSCSYNDSHVKSSDEAKDLLQYVFASDLHENFENENGAKAWSADAMNYFNAAAKKLGLDNLSMITTRENGKEVAHISAKKNGKEISGTIDYNDSHVRSENDAADLFNYVLNESFNNVSIETDDQKMTMTSEDNGKVTVTTEPIEAAPTAEEGEMIAPISDDIQDEIITASAEAVEEEPTEEVVEETPAEEEEMDFDIDELDEEGMDELGESYLKRVYENVDSFKTSSVSTSGNKLFIEGMINFKSGASKKTGFIFEAKEATRDGKVKFIGENAHLCRGKRSFTLAGSLNENKLMVESLTYNYRAKNSDGKSTRVYGTISRNK